MIPLVVPASSDAAKRFVVRLSDGRAAPGQARLVERRGSDWLFASDQGQFMIACEEPLLGDVVCIDPSRNLAERLIRVGSTHNTLLITEQCDQLCVMCSQPPKKKHNDRFAEYLEAVALAPEGMVIGLSGGEPALHKRALFKFLQKAREERPDLFFHILSNGQHFFADDMDEIRACRNQTLWGIPLYSHQEALHDEIVGKSGAFERLLDAFTFCLTAGMRIELRTVLLRANYAQLPEIARFIADHLGFVSQWSIMQLENIGFAKNRFDALYVDQLENFAPLAEAVDIATLFGINVALFNMPRCAVPPAYRRYAMNSISDWKQVYPEDCAACAEKADCPGFFAWHPANRMRVRSI